MHSWWKTQDFSEIESGPNYTTAAHAFVKATLRLGLRAPFVARNNNKINARALIGQSAMVYCAGKPMEKSRVF